MKCNNKFYWYVKSFHLTIYWKVFVLYFNLFSTTFKHHYKIISQGSGKLVTYTPCLKCHIHKKLTGLRTLYVGIGSLVCIINLLITPVGNVLMRLGYQGKGTEDFNRQWPFSDLETIIVKAILVPGNSFSFWLTSFKKDAIFYYINLMHKLCTKL